MAKKSPKKLLILALALLFLLVLTKSLPTLLARDTESSKKSSEGSTQADRVILTSPPSLTLPFFSTAKETSLSSACSLPVITEKTAPISPKAPTVTPALTPVTGLEGTPPVAITQQRLPAVWVTGLVDTPPIDVGAVSPTAASPEVAAFVATAYALDFPKSEVRSAKALKEELDTIVEKAKASGISTLYFQVRPASDAFYESSLFPTSRYLVEKEGEQAPIDVLRYLIERAHREGLFVHAWINPYRIRSAAERDIALSPDHPARLDPSLAFTVKGGYYYQPAKESVRQLIAAGVGEIVSRYDVDGILLDDYFYPEGIKDEDAALYEQYRQTGGKLSLGDWRREEITRMIRLLYQTVKQERPDCLFGVSVRGIWKNQKDDPAGSPTKGADSYSVDYADPLLWAREGIVDHIAPQLYWSFNDPNAPFVPLADWWQNALSTTKAKLTVALAPYRIPASELKAQIFYLSMQASPALALFRFSYL